MVVAIIGILASIVLASLGYAREQARNKAVVQQMDQYAKALELYYSDNGRYPSGFSANNAVQARRAYCIGSSYTGTPNFCLPSGAFNVSTLVGGNVNSHIETALVPNYIPSLPNATINVDGVQYMSPAYMNSDYLGTSGTEYRTYTLWYALEGVGQNCGKGVDNGVAPSVTGITLCRLSLGN